MSPEWTLRHHREPAADFHARDLPERIERSVWVCEATGPALVLGSAQRDLEVDRAACERAGVAVVRRRSGGGAVLVDPGALLWVDVLIGAEDPTWERDVGASFSWIGDVWARALADLGHPASVHRGPMRRTPWSRRVCFAGIGPGELTDAQGAKVVGISQRRARAGARFQCAALLAPWDPGATVGLLALSDAEREAAAQGLAGVAAGVGLPADALLEAFLRHLP